MTGSLTHLGVMTVAVICFVDLSPYPFMSFSPSAITGYPLTLEFSTAKQKSTG